MLIALGVLGGCTQSGLTLDPSIRTGTVLPACTSEGTEFSRLPFAQWVDAYHTRVAAVIDEHLERTEKTDNIDCAAEEKSLPPGELLHGLAGELPEWESKERLGALTQADAGEVLKAYLRAYLCSLQERASVLAIAVQNPGGSSSSVSGMAQPQFLRTTFSERGIIQRELATARPALERTLTIASRRTELAALHREASCLQGSLVNVRNAMGLLSEVGMCLPTAWDAQGSLFALPSAAK
jgi:hypothetical protein